MLPKQNVLDLGVKRIVRNKQLTIEIYNMYERFLPIILLREAYYCFIPDSLRENETLKIIINQIIETDLEKIEIIDEWKSLVRKQLVNYDYLSAQFDRIDKFLKLQGTESHQRPLVFFFEYIRKNVQIIDDDNKDEFYDNIFKEFVLKTSKSLRNDEIIETIRVLIKIFYKVKSYRALLDYQEYFKEMKLRGEIKTELSLRKFTSNMKWINKYSYLAPAYQVNWKALNVAVIACKLRFNPLITKSKIDQVVENLPFFVFSKSSESNFSIEVAGWFVVPHIYLKDLKIFLQKFDQNGYIINKTCILVDRFENFLNLNYFRDFYIDKRIINPNHPKYSEKYEIHANFDYGKNFIDENCSLLDFLILERIRYFSITGFSFERRSETLKQLKKDLFNEILSQRTEIKVLKKNLLLFHLEEDLRIIFLQFLERNKKFGFFYIKELINSILLVSSSIYKVLNDNPNLRTIAQFNEFTKKHGISNSHKENIIFRDNKVREIFLKDLIPIFFRNKNEFKEILEKYKFFYNFFNLCSKLKIFNLNVMIRIIQDESLTEKIFIKKEKKLKQLHERYKTKMITSYIVDELLDGYINRKPSLIRPLLISTFSTNTVASYYLHLVVRDCEDTNKILNDIKKYFPRMTFNYGNDVFNNDSLIQIEIYLPNINKTEKSSLISVLFNLFNDNLISTRRYFWDGFMSAYSRRNFFDFEKQEFFYTNELFSQYFQYCEEVFGRKFHKFQESTEPFSKMLLSKENDMNKFVKYVADRISRENIEYDIEKLKELSYFYENLQDILKNPKMFKRYKHLPFFIQYIHSIKFKPALKQFGFDTFYLYIRPIDNKETDIKLLLSNSFQKVKYSASFNIAPAFFIKYVFPEDRPNKTHLNYIVKSKKIISEYCLFKITKIHQVVHFEKILGQNGWILSEKAFNTHIQRILYNPDYEPQISGMKSFNLDDKNNSDIFLPISKEFKDLSKVYSYKSLDLKSLFISNRKTQINLITDLLKKKIIFPILKLKNLGLGERLYLILPDVKEESIPLLLRVFHYFPVVSCYEIKGEWFINGLRSEKKFVNGLFIKLDLPDNINISGFQKAFDSIFEYFRINKRLILTDMIDGSEMIKSFYWNFEFLKTYNPLKNFIWSKDDQKWLNIKLYGENFIKKYPDLV